ncbi:MAG: sigma-54-dependent Fis family transcriptional regulator [Desulfovibrionaceae bacterium]|nr:sigma-54-dependent Fis family transcriptional regulator [Desulfovibrionaceae bacterium]
MFFDYYGWILFQSEDPYKKEYENLPLSFDIVRSGLKGDLSKPDFKSAFRPAVQYDNYHKMVELIRSGRSGHFDLPKGDEGWSSNQANAECISFAPVKFQASNENSPEIIGGIALLDTTFLVSHTYNSILKLFLTCFFMTSVLLSACLWWIGRYTKRCILSLNQALLDRNQTLSTDPLKLPNLPTEVQQLQENTNILLQRLIQAKTDQASYLASHKVKKQNEPLEQLPDPEELKQHLLVGNSPPIVALRNKINTVAKVDGDVLITGETGTGKELVSQAIHAASDRADKPFISINCGALDESLLMDTLFGHVKGAFTEARQNRKGAFIAADGGTLLLDEIGNATPKVQQALLRALSIRKVRPLGSDHDLDFSTRIIAATNADLRNDGKDGGFRNDLYFRLSVFSIHTTPLRECKQDILPLIVHFIYNLISTKAPGLPKKMPVITRGALEKLQEYDWPGNMRELKNIITRAVAFCQNDILLASDILFDEYEPDEPTQSEDININKIKLPDFNEILSKLNYRQQSIFPIILKQGSITRNEYQKLAGDNISMRTAQYDLQEMISLGLIRKEGRGPAMRYMVDCSNYKDVINF